MEKSKRYRKRNAIEEDEADLENDTEIRSVVEEVKLIQKQRERMRTHMTDIAGPGVQKATIPANDANQNAETEGGEELVLQDTFEQEAAVTMEDPNMLKYVEQELAKRRGRGSMIEKDEKQSAEDNLYVIPEHLKVQLTSADEGSTSWTTGIAEIQLPIDYKLKNIEETEAAKKALQEKRPFIGRPRNSNIPASFSADYFQRGKEYTERLRKDHPELFKDKDSHARRRGSNLGPGEVLATDNLGVGPALGSRNNLNDFHSDDRNRRQAATDDILMERFRKRERNRVRR